MRSMLFRGASVQDSIATAKQIQGWSAEATGQKPVETPSTSTLPMLMAQQQQAQAQSAVPPAVPPGMPQPPAAVPQAPPAAPAATYASTTGELR